MEIKRGADVFTADGRKVGDVERIVLNPVTREVTHIVVDKGLMFAEDQVIPFDWIESAEGDRVTLNLNLTEEEMDAVPVYEDLTFIPLTPDSAPEDAISPTPLAWYPSLGMPWWDYPGMRGFYSRPAFVVEEEDNIPEGTVALREGARIISADGEHVGNLERVLTGVEATATHLVISQGVLFKHRKLVPLAWVQTVEEDRVVLAVNAEVLDRVENYED
ncbi:MAG TPA: DUF2171 domain-containing protein [Aggregatilineales bacterium]|nr:DUF2171 domain-containing protein [Aggregatilineales bacterium]